MFAVLIVLLGLAAVAIFAYLARDAFVVIAKNRLDRPTDTSLRAKKNLADPFLTVHWPDNPHSEAQRAITFKIPREYVHQSTTFMDEKGIKSIAIMFELPNATPWQDRPWLDRMKGTPEYAEFKKTWHGKFTMDIERTHAVLYESRMGTREMLQREAFSVEQSDTTSTASLRLADQFGLERYTNVSCYGPETLRNRPEILKHLKVKLIEDSTPANCAIDDIHWMTLLSPPEVTTEDGAVFISCMGSGCYAYFSIQGRGIRMGLSYNDLARWREFTQPARQLANKFIVQEARDLELPRYL